MWNGEVKKESYVDKELAQWLSVPATLPEDPGWIPSPHMATYNHLYLQSHAIPFWPRGTRHASNTQSYIQTKHPHTEKEKGEEKKEAYENLEVDAWMWMELCMYMSVACSYM